MSDATDQMKKSLKEVVVPYLRERGFTGSFPHLRRRRAIFDDHFRRLNPGVSVD
jgi:hypothetical protein